MTVARLGRILRQRLTALVRRERLERELDRELAFHLDGLVEEMVADGWPRADAQREARRQLGHIDSVRDACRDEWHVAWWHDLRADVRYGLRVLAAAPAFTAVALVSLALGIGANAAVLRVDAAVRFDSLPIADADRLIVIRSVAQDEHGSLGRGVSGADYLAFKARTRTVERIELALASPRDLGDEGAVPGERVIGQAVTAGFFELLGVQPALGRLFTAEESRTSARVVILSHELWQRRYGADPGILNRRIPIDAGKSVVVGVMPASYRHRNPRVDFWSTMFVPPTTRPVASRLFFALGRLQPWATVEGAQQELSAIAAGLAVESPATNKGWDVRITTLRDDLHGWTREPLTNLQVAVALVLLMACTNLAVLLLARGTVRRREIAMRVALGAGRARVVRQLLTESLLLSIGGAAIGLLVAWAGIRALSAMPPPLAAAPLSDVHLDWRTLVITGALAVGTGLLSGVLPAFTASKPAPRVRGTVLRGSLVAVQVAIAFSVLVGFGLLVTSYVRLTYRHLNFEPAQLLRFDARTQGSSDVLQRIHERLKAVRGVESAAGISFPPVDSLILPTVDVRLDIEHPHVVPRRAAYFLITPGIFKTLRTPILSGRELTNGDNAASPWVAIVNAAAVRQFWPGHDPIGRRLRLDLDPQDRPREIIGVVADIPTRHGQIDPQPIVYASYLQQPAGSRGPLGVMSGQMTFFVRYPSDAMSLAGEIRKAVANVSARPIGSMMTAEQRRGLGAVRIELTLRLLAFLAATAALLAAIGVHGSLAYTVMHRSREIGVRKALGASHERIVFFIGRGAAIAVLAGLALGCLTARASTRLLASQLWGIAPTDAMTYGAAAVLLAAAASLACVGPARRALAVDPAIVLRSEA